MALITDNNLVGEWMTWDTDKITSRSPEITRAIESASATIKRKCGRVFESVTETRLFDVPITDDEVILGDFRNITLLEVRPERGDFSTLNSDKFEYRKINNSWPYFSIRRIDSRYFPRGTLRVTADWEWDEVPDAIQQATIMQAAKILSRVSSPRGQASNIEGTNIQMGRVMDFDIEDLISDYMVAHVGT